MATPPTQRIDTEKKGEGNHSKRERPSSKQEEKETTHFASVTSSGIFSVIHILRSLDLFFGSFDPVTSNRYFQP
ncbi:hypothetical protein PCANC_01097 [Puccinia coronata f. sp. avenae]|uniref:Uncharacterized protein n=1 Tax=Puccinia coronata f. sp. avenae TaxID=200324 RepID=A0A2N5W5V7_9BASI|nr:hypothetical protein PCANC_01097 [Puccinia coronata f. sp. avenae]